MADKKPYEPKTKFQAILEYHSDWLFRQGYHERTLGSREPQGKLVERLRETFEEAIMRTLWTYRIEEFRIGARGIFGTKKDPVDFMFDYRYDPHRERLSLSKLSARLYDETIEYVLTNNTPRQLPPADLVHAQLSSVIDAKIHEKLKEQQKSRRSRKGLQ